MELPTVAVRPARPGRHRRGAHPEEKAVRAAVRQLCAERIEPHVAGWSEGTVEMHTLVVGQAMTGQAAFR
ncbi:hypothetical protein [Amycolatopsis sp. 3B14]|uniref:hypothetical protein n=1 Tax=Amycolatopsis sp. 3B14 TaxID=3243600 RepID=UPI003D9574DA